MNRYWENEYTYESILEILEDYWITEPEEAAVQVKMHFVHRNGETQSKCLTWFSREATDKEKQYARNYFRAMSTDKE